MAKAKPRTPGSLKALLVLPWKKRIWVRDFMLPFPPFPGLDIRVDVYELLKVESVVVGDYGYDVTCLVTIQLAVPSDAKHYTIERIRSLGFEEGGYP
jgi:hypothetical protein